jgi:hypothetical protein
MKALCKMLALLMVFSIATPTSSSAQIFQKLKKKAKEMILGEDEKEESTVDTPSSPRNSNGKKVKGKKLAPPDVQTLLSNASTSLDAKNYSALRYEIKQAMVGVELEIGYQILESMPKAIDNGNMPYIENGDEVVSTGAGFIGLAIGRQYEDDVRNINARIVNNSTMLAFYNGFLTGSTYNSSSNEVEHKPVTIQGMKGAIHFNGDNKYELGVPLGQSSIFLLECYNCADENVLMSNANQFDLADFKVKLGEQ